MAECSISTLNTVLTSGSNYLLVVFAYDFNLVVSWLDNSGWILELESNIFWISINLFLFVISAQCKISICSHLVYFICKCAQRTPVAHCLKSLEFEIQVTSIYD